MILFKVKSKKKFFWSFRCTVFYQNTQWLPQYLLPLQRNNWKFTAPLLIKGFENEALQHELTDDMLYSFFHTIRQVVCDSYSGVCITRGVNM